MDTGLGLTIFQAVAAVAALAVAAWAAIQSSQTGKIIKQTNKLLEDFNVAFGVKAGLEGGTTYLATLDFAYKLKDLVAEDTISEKLAETILNIALKYVDEVKREAMVHQFKQSL